MCRTGDLYSFLECLKEGARRPLSPKSFFVEGKAGTGKSLCVVSMIRTFAGTVLCDELKMMTKRTAQSKDHCHIVFECGSERAKRVDILFFYS